MKYDIFVCIKHWLYQRNKNKNFGWEMKAGIRYSVYQIHGALFSIVYDSNRTDFFFIFYQCLYALYMCAITFNTIFNFVHMTYAFTKYECQSYRSGLSVYLGRYMIDKCFLWMKQKIYICRILKEKKKISKWWNESSIETSIETSITALNYLRLKRTVLFTLKSDKLRTRFSFVLMKWSGYFIKHLFGRKSVSESVE